MNQREVIYEKESEFRKQIYLMKRIQFTVYKKIIFILLPRLKDGEILGNKVGENQYEIELQIEPKMMDYIHGGSRLVYRVENEQVILVEIAPKALWSSSYDDLKLYRGYYIHKDNMKEKFKVDLLDQIRI